MDIIPLQNFVTTKKKNDIRGKGKNGLYRKNPSSRIGTEQGWRMSENPRKVVIEKYREEQKARAKAAVEKYRQERKAKEEATAKDVAAKRSKKEEQEQEEAEAAAAASKSSRTRRGKGIVMPL